MVYLLVLLWLDSSSVMGLRLQGLLNMRFEIESLPRPLKNMAVQHTLHKMSQQPQALQKAYASWAPALIECSAYRVVTFAQLQLENVHALSDFTFTPCNKEMKACSSGNCEGDSW